MIHTVMADFSQFNIQTAITPRGVPDRRAEDNRTGLVRNNGRNLLTFVSLQHRAPMPVDIEVLESEPELPGSPWSDIVELPLTPASEVVLCGWEGQNDRLPLPLDPGRDYRVRYAIANADLAREYDGTLPQEQYQIRIWPAPRSEPAILRNESAHAQYWTFQQAADRAKLAVANVPEGARTAAIIEIALTEHPEVARRIAVGEARYISGVLAYTQKIYPYEMEYNEVQELIDKLARSREW